MGQMRSVKFGRFVGPCTDGRLRLGKTGCSSDAIDNASPEPRVSTVSRASHGLRSFQRS